MLLNPELYRNIWLSFTPHRLMLTPVIIGLIVYVYYLMDKTAGAANVAFYLACFFIFLWGTRSASETVINEVNNNTWDFQRQSTIRPWSMAWGKLLGSTLFSWFGAGICLGIYVFFHASNTMAHIAVNDSIILILGGLFTQTLAILLSMQILPQIRREHTHSTFHYFIAALIIGWVITQWCFSTQDTSLSIHWHQWNFALSAFSLTSLILFLGWAILGLQRSFCRELQYATVPWAWLGFNLFCMIYFPGFFTDNANQTSDLIGLSSKRFPDISTLVQHAPYYVALAIAQGLTYIALLTDTLTTVRYQKFFARCQEKSLEALQQLPWWCISLILTLIAAFLAVTFQPQYSTEFLDKFSPTIFIMTSCLFLFRDVALIHYFSFGPKPQSALGTSMVYLFLLYLLLPLLLSALHLSNLLPLFIPSWGTNTLLGVLSACGQIAFIGMLCLRRWHTQSVA